MEDGVGASRRAVGVSAKSYGVHISLFIRFARAADKVGGFNKGIKLLMANYL